MSNCAVCHTSMTREIDGQPVSIIGMRWEIKEDAAWGLFRHKPGVYEVCFSCALEALGVIPNLSQDELADRAQFPAGWNKPRYTMPERK